MTRLLSPLEESAPPSVDLKFHRQQSLILTPKANEILYGGAAGGGKSHGMRIAAIYYCLQIPGLFCALFRKTFPELVRNHLEGPGSFYVLLAALIKSGHARIVKGEVRFYNGSKIVLAHLQHEKHRYAWQGAEIHLLLFDELTHFSEQAYRYLRGRCRLGQLKVPEQFAGMFPRIISGSNPGGVGHTWVKRTFVNNRPYNIIHAEKEEGGMLRTYVPALLKDNPSLTENDPEYENKLYGLGDKTLVRSMLDGDWSIVAGSMFGDVWRHNAHVCPAFAVPDDWPLWRGGDDGYAAPTAILWFTEDPATKTIYVIDELYKAGLLPDALARRILSHDQKLTLLTQDGEETKNTRKLKGIYDAAAFGDTGQQNSIPRGATLNTLGCAWTPCEKWPGSRVAGCQHIHRMLGPNLNDPSGLDQEGKMTYRPKLRFFHTCWNVIESIPTLPRDDKEPEDVDTDAEDHLYDALRYGLQWKTNGGFKKAQVQGL